MNDDLHFTQSAVTATASGNLTWGSWTLDASTALGMSGRKNPLGFALVRYVADEGVATMLAVVLILSTQMIRRGGVEPDRANEVAQRAFDFWNNRLCPACGGHGREATGCVCRRCIGEGVRPLSDAPEEIRDAIDVLVRAEEWMDAQLRKRLR